jgi:hypothetical protein
MDNILSSINASALTMIKKAEAERMDRFLNPVKFYAERINGKDLISEFSQDINARILVKLSSNHAMKEFIDGLSADKIVRDLLDEGRKRLLDARLDRGQNIHYFGSRGNETFIIKEDYSAPGVEKAHLKEPRKAIAWVMLKLIIDFYKKKGVVRLNSRILWKNLAENKELYDTERIISSINDDCIFWGKSSISKNSFRTMIYRYEKQYRDYILFAIK